MLEPWLLSVNRSRVGAGETTLRVVGEDDHGDAKSLRYRTICTYYLCVCLLLSNAPSLQGEHPGTLVLDDLYGQATSPTQLQAQTGGKNVSILRI